MEKTNFYVLKSQVLNPDYIVGFIDGEGSFNMRLPFYWEPNPLPMGGALQFQKILTDHLIID